MENLHIIKVTFKGPTNHKGSRLILHSERFNQSVTLSKDYSLNSILDQGVQWLQSNGFEVIGVGEGKSSDYIITTTFKELK